MRLRDRFSERLAVSLQGAFDPLLQMSTRKRVPTELGLAMELLQPACDEKKIFRSSPGPRRSTREGPPSRIRFGSDDKLTPAECSERRWNRSLHLRIEPGPDRRRDPLFVFDLLVALGQTRELQHRHGLCGARAERKNHEPPRRIRARPADDEWPQAFSTKLRGDRRVPEDRRMNISSRAGGCSDRTVAYPPDFQGGRRGRGSQRRVKKTAKGRRRAREAPQIPFHRRPGLERQEQLRTVEVRLDPIKTSERQVRSSKGSQDPVFHPPPRSIAMLHFPVERSSREKVGSGSFTTNVCISENRDSVCGWVARETLTDATSETDVEGDIAQPLSSPEQDHVLEPLVRDRKQNSPLGSAQIVMVERRAPSPPRRGCLSHSVVSSAGPAATPPRVAARRALPAGFLRSFLVRNR